MNAHAQAYMADTPMAARLALLDAVEIYNNDDEVSYEIAIEAIASGRAAFWTTSKYHDQIGSVLVNEANTKLMDDAIAFIPPFKRDGMERYLDTLVPLNAKAETALSLAYAKHTSTWRDEPELAMRRVRDCRKSVA